MMTVAQRGSRAELPVNSASRALFGQPAIFSAGCEPPATSGIGMTGHAAKKLALAHQRLADFKTELADVLHAVSPGIAFDPPQDLPQAPHIRLVVIAQGTNTCPLCREVFVFKADPADQDVPRAKNGTDSNRRRFFVQKHKQRHQDSSGNAYTFIEYAGSGSQAL
jgi:hypothetical protein